MAQTHTHRTATQCAFWSTAAWSISTPSRTKSTKASNSPAKSSNPKRTTQAVPKITSPPALLKATMATPSSPKPLRTLPPWDPYKSWKSTPPTCTYLSASHELDLSPRILPTSFQSPKPISSSTWTTNLHTNTQFSISLTKATTKTSSSLKNSTTWFCTSKQNRAISTKSLKVSFWNKLELEMNIFDAFRLAKIKHPELVDNELISKSCPLK